MLNQGQLITIIGELLDKHHIKYTTENNRTEYLNLPDVREYSFLYLFEYGGKEQRINIVKGNIVKVIVRIDNGNAYNNFHRVYNLEQIERVLGEMTQDKTNKLFKEINESLDEVSCKCGWVWKMESDDDRPYWCHKCGYDNKKGKYYKKDLKEWKKINENSMGNVFKKINEDIEGEEEALVYFNRLNKLLDDLSKNKKAFNEIQNRLKGTFVFGDETIVFISLSKDHFLNQWKMYYKYPWEKLNSNPILDHSVTLNEARGIPDALKSLYNSIINLINTDDVFKKINQ